MSESIYEEPDYSNINTTAGNKTETTYANVERNSSRQKIQLNKIQDSPGGRNHGCYKLAVVLLGLLCVLLLAVIAGLGIMARQLQLRYNNFTNENDLVRHEEHKQEKANQTNLIKDLEARNNNLMRENKQLQARHTTLTAEKSQLETNLRAMTGERDELRRRLGKVEAHNNNLSGENKQLQATLTAEKSQLETNLRAMTGERDELQRRLCKLESESMKQIKRFAVAVTLDPDTAHPKLILSADGKQAKVGERRHEVQKTSKRFWTYTCVLGKQGVSSGKFYYEVQVLGKSDWDVGVARESINRDNLTLSTQNGFWTIWLRNGTEYSAIEQPRVPLPVKEKLQRVGVYVDYEAGLVSFYDADCWCHLHSFTKANFNGRIYPYFFVFDSDPIIIQPVVKCMSVV